MELWQIDVSFFFNVFDVFFVFWMTILFFLDHKALLLFSKTFLATGQNSTKQLQ